MCKKIIILQINCLKNKFFLVGMLSKSQEEPIIQFCLSFCFFNNDKKDHPKLRGSMYSLRNCRPFSNLDISFANLNERSESGSHVFFFFQEIILADVIRIIIQYSKRVNNFSLPPPTTVFHTIICLIFLERFTSSSKEVIISCQIARVMFVFRINNRAFATSAKVSALALALTLKVKD